MRRRAIALALLGMFALRLPAAAHLQVLQGKLVDLVQRSDAIVIATIDSVTDRGGQHLDTTITIAHVLGGTMTDTHLTFPGPTRFAPGEPYVIFLRRVGTGFASAQDSGTVFPCPPADEAIYRSTIAALTRALRTDVAGRADAVRAALIPALSATVLPLRYHAALELRALAHTGHPPNANERVILETLLRAPATDPALQPLLDELVRLAERTDNRLMHNRQQTEPGR